MRKKVKHIHRWSNWWKVKVDNSMERLCLSCGEIQSAGKVNRVIMGWALSNRRKGISCHTAQMPIRQALTTISQKTKKAYGNCDLCFGKGYSTQLENYSGRGESDIGQGGIEVRGQTPYYLPCSCDRGKQIKEMIEKAREEAEYTIHEVHGEGGRTVDGQTLYWAKVRKTLKDN